MALRGMNSVAGDLLDAGGDVPRMHDDGASPSIYRVYGDSGGLEEDLDLGLQVSNKKLLEQEIKDDRKRRHSQKNILATLVSAKESWPQMMTWSICARSSSWRASSHWWRRSQMSPWVPSSRAWKLSGSSASASR